MSFSFDAAAPNLHAGCKRHYTPEKADITRAHLKITVRYEEGEYGLYSQIWYRGARLPGHTAACRLCATSHTRPLWLSRKLESARFPRIACDLTHLHPMDRADNIEAFRVWLL